MRNLARIAWAFLCMLVGGVLVGAGAGLHFESWPIGAAGATVGAVLGYVFARLVSPLDMLEETLP